MQNSQVIRAEQIKIVEGKRYVLHRRHLYPITEENGELFMKGKGYKIKILIDNLISIEKKE